MQLLIYSMKRFFVVVCLFVFLTGGKTESPVSAQQCAAAILGMDRKPMVQTFFSAVKTNYLLNSGVHHQRK